MFRRRQNSHLILLFMTLSEYISIAITLIGVVVLLGWIFDISAIKSVPLDLASMKSNTAACFILTGISIFLQQTRRSRLWTISVAKVFASCVALIGLLTILEYIFDCSLGMDQLIVKDLSPDVSTFSPGRMSPNTALNFLVIGITLLILNVKIRNTYHPFQYLNLATSAISLLAFVTYVYDIRSLYFVVPYRGMALHTTVTFVITCASIFLSRPDQGIVAVLVSAGGGGVLARRLLPIAIGIPLFLGWLALFVQKIWIPNIEFTIAFIVIFTIIIFTFFIWQYARILERKDTERETMFEQVQELSYAVEQSPNTVVITDTNGNIQYVNQKFTQLTGYTSAEIIGKNPRTLKSNKMPPEGYKELWRTITSGREWSGEIINKKKNGEFYWEKTLIGPIKNSEGIITHFVSVKEDVTERKMMEAELKILSTTDKLTQAYNRTKFDEIILKEFAFSRRYNKPLSLVMIDIDHFKGINDNFGHNTGDYVLKTVSGIIKDTIRETDYLVRWGGEEFLVVATNMRLEEARELSERIRNEIEKYAFDQGTVTASLGITQYKTGDTVHTLLQRADAALYLAKNNGRNRSELLM